MLVLFSLFPSRTMQSVILYVPLDNISSLFTSIKNAFFAWDLTFFPFELNKHVGTELQRNKPLIIVIPYISIQMLLYFLSMWAYIS